MLLDLEKIRACVIRLDAFRGSTIWHSFCHSLVAVLAMVAFAVTTPSAAAQTPRGTEIIEGALAAQPDERHGATVYRNQCASCHGKRARGSSTSVTPSLAGQLNIYLIKQLADFAEGDRTETDMHRIVARKQLGAPQTMRDVSSYLSHLPANNKPEVGDGEDLATGKRYYDGLCAFCHGPRGEGNEQHATPSLQRQHYSYLLMQSRRLAMGHRYSVPSEVMEVLQKLPLDKLTAVCDYASRLPDVAIPTADGITVEPQHEPSDP